MKKSTKIIIISVIVVVALVAGGLGAYWTIVNKVDRKNRKIK